jgi:hypothetical protein
LKLGFKISFTEDRNRDWYKILKLIHIKIISLNYAQKPIIADFFDIGYGNKYLDLYYAHQLQNLYLVLTGRIVFKTEIEP